ncbi:MAG TPA: antitoxin family protein [Patescibacteria group bacterium]|nr:antitoxin family protein [Patescibacteria group bacterium]
MPAKVTAVFRDGVLRPTRKLKLQPNEKVTLQILRRGKTAVTEDLGPLAGAFPELAALSDKDLTAAKQIWTHRLDKEVRMLPRKGPRH